MRIPITSTSTKCFPVIVRIYRININAVDVDVDVDVDVKVDTIGILIFEEERVEQVCNGGANLLLRWYYYNSFLQNVYHTCYTIAQVY